jgi:V8-like Glu-specific endopeptidase
LISSRLVLTAAHCLFDKTTGERIDHSNVEFRAGWRNGRASASRQVYRAVVHPDYDYNEELNSVRVSNDLALLELRWPIRNGVIRPFRTGLSPRRGDRVATFCPAKKACWSQPVPLISEAQARRFSVSGMVR